ncbi:extracellular solute-binding protein [Streptomyces shenzhenensis]|uniref:extracellular solute-binding protein n=1 Tax=Streptomyces shenzhenensis TaxID=943815 RepID=UPI0015F03C33|nr:extracellular solute-binding protein [Streptomyces shenzhenensis]
MTGRPLRLLGRDFAGFRRAAAAHSAAWPAGTVTARWVELPVLQQSVLRQDADADLLLVPADWLPALAARGAIAGLDGQLARRQPEGWPDAWSASFLEGVSFSGQVWGLPFHDGPQLLFTRSDLYAAHGLTPPATWAELAGHAARLHEPGRCAGTVLAGAPDGHNNVYDFLVHLRRYGGDLFGDDGVVLDGQPARRALSFLRELVTTVVDPRAHALDSADSGVEFAEGRVAVTVNWAGFAALAADGPVAGRFDTAVVPAHDDGHPTTTVNAFWALAVSSRCDRPELAWDYLCHTASAAMDRATSRAGASGVRKSTWTDPDVLGRRPEYRLFEAAHEHSRPLPRIPRIVEVVEVLNELVDAVVWCGEEAGPALARAHARIEDELRASPRKGIS